QAGAMAEGYGTYMLEMGRPIAITDLARKMIEVMGAQNVQIKFIGLRPGEKLREELSGEGEQQVSTDHPMVFQLVSEGMASEDADFLGVVDEMVYRARSQEGGKALNLLRQAVPNYSSIDVSAEAYNSELRYPPEWND
ncbi:MAG: polysaccharide biosynthesis protein, partial [Actinomycetota bacterium]|nr:polysaccharide biosynthesis protein [Actinomycetota bacterium]